MAPREGLDAGDPRLASTLLFVPGDRPERFGPAAMSGADVVILDLEDGVSPPAREAARRHVRTWLELGRPALVRISARGTEDHRLDVVALRDIATHVMLAKTESADDATATAAELGDYVGVVALVETPRGLASATDIATENAVVRLALGNVDLAAELGFDPTDRQALLAARSSLVLASAVAGLHGPIDGVTTRFDEPEVVASDAAHAVSLGFRGKLLIHPRQLDAAQAGLAPTIAEVSWARDILAAASAGEARAVDGAMVDRAVEERARGILSRVPSAADDYSASR